MGEVTNKERAYIKQLKGRKNGGYVEIVASEGVGNLKWRHKVIRSRQKIRKKT